MDFSPSLEKLINEFSKLPGVGQKTAQRYAFKIINGTREEAEAFALAVMEAKEKIHYCKVCGNYTDDEICDICRNRESGVICVVKDPKDVVALEKTREFKWGYHVLHGTISPLKGIMPEQLNIKSLLERINEGGVEELVMALNPDIEGDATSMYIASLVKPLGIAVTRLACGIQAGSEIEYADYVTLSKAFSDRKPI